MKRKILCLLLMAFGLPNPSSYGSSQAGHPSDSLRLVVRVQSAPGQAGQLRALLQKLVEPTRQEPGCLAYELHESMTTPGLFLLDEQWADQRALAEHRASEHYRTASGQAERQGLLAREPEFILNPEWMPLTELEAEISQTASPISPARPGGASQPILFAPGEISTGAYELNAAFSRDGQTLYFARSMPVFPFPNTFTTILVSRRQGAKWGEPRVASFSGIYSDIDPYLSADESRLYFMSNRPLQGSQPKEDFDLWVVSRDGSGWGAPRNLGEPVNTQWLEGYPALADNGNLYFFSIRPGGYGSADLYRAVWEGDHYAAPQNLGPAVNGASAETNVEVAPDESFIIFSSARLSSPQDPFARLDLYVSFRRGDSWSEAESLGEKVNTPGWEFTPILSPDGKYLFFTRATPRQDLRHKEGRAIGYRELEELLHGPQNGLGDIFYIQMSVLRPEW